MVIGISLLLLSATVFTIEVIGVFKMKYSLNRMHSAAMGDTLGLLSGLIGLMILSGFNFATLKMFLVLIFLWCTSPVASHLIARMEYSTFDKIAERAEFVSAKGTWADTAAGAACAMEMPRPHDPGTSSARHSQVCERLTGQLAENSDLTENSERNSVLEGEAAPKEAAYCETSSAPDEAVYNDANSGPDESIYNDVNSAAHSEKPDDLSEMLARF